MSERKPKIFVYCNSFSRRGFDEYFALSEDGKILGSHICSSDEWAKKDMGVIDGYRPDRHKIYKDHYPDGYEMEFVETPWKHEGIDKACSLYHLRDKNDRCIEEEMASFEIEVKERS